MRSINLYTEMKDIPPYDERQWDYYFSVGERVKLIPKLSVEWMDVDIITLEDEIGVVTRCWSDLICNYGSSYVCDVQYKTKKITLLTMFFYTSKKFYI